MSSSSSYSHAQRLVAFTTSREILQHCTSFLCVCFLLYEQLVLLFTLWCIQSGLALLHFLTICHRNVQFLNSVPTVAVRFMLKSVCVCIFFFFFVTPDCALKSDQNSRSECRRKANLIALHSSTSTFPIC